MNHSRIRPVRNVLVAVGAIAFLQWSFVELKTLSRINPFDQYRTSSDELDPRFVVSLEETEFRHYKGPLLQASANVGRLDVMNDEHTIDLHAVRDGMMVRDGRKYHFDATDANYMSASSLLTVRSNAHLSGSDFDLRSDNLTFDGNREILDVVSPVSGKFHGGDLVAATFHYVVPSGYFKATKITYNGPVDFDADLRQATQAKRTHWDFHCDNMEQSKTDKNVLLYSAGDATDGEIIVSAPHFESNNKTDVLVATGGIKYFSAKSNVIADKITVFRKEKRAVLEGHVQMLVKPKKDEDAPPKVEVIPPFTPSVPESISTGRAPAPNTDLEAQKKQDETVRSAKNIHDYPMVVVCDRIEYFYEKGKRSANISGHPQARQELPEGAWRYIWASSAKYDGEAETMLLRNSAPNKKDVRLKNSIGDDIIAIEITVSTKDDDDYFKATKPEGVVYTLDDDDPREKKPTKGNDKKVPPPPLKGKIGG